MTYDQNTRVTIGRPPSVFDPRPEPTSEELAAADWERELAENPIGMSAAAYRRMEGALGIRGAWQRRQEVARAQASRVKVTAR